MLGFFNFTCSVVLPGRAFLHLHILYALTHGLSKPYYHVRMSSDSRADLAAWKVFLQHFNGRSVFLIDRWVSSTSLHLFTDASTTLGFGGFLVDAGFLALGKLGIPLAILRF